MESLILAQNERWRHGLGMQVERSRLRDSGEGVSNAWVTCLEVGDSPAKVGLIPNVAFCCKAELLKEQSALRWTRVLLACWWGNGSPRLRQVGGLRGCSPTLGLRHCPDSYGRLQSRIFRNERKLDGAMPREGWRLSGRKPLSPGTNNWRCRERKPRLTTCQQPR